MSPAVEKVMIAKKGRHEQVSEKGNIVDDADAWEMSKIPRPRRRINRQLKLGRGRSWVHINLLEGSYSRGQTKTYWYSKGVNRKIMEGLK